jgi:hypothetical protein
VLAGSWETRQVTAIGPRAAAADTGAASGHGGRGSRFVPEECSSHHDEMELTAREAANVQKGQTIFGKLADAKDK